MDTFDVRSERRPGHFWADNEILDVYAAQIGIFGFAVYMAIVRFTDNHGVARPSVATLAKRLAVSETTIRKAVDILVQADLLRIEPQTRERDGHTSYLSNRYIICSVPKDPGYLTTGGTSPREVGGTPREVGGTPRDPLKKKTLSTIPSFKDQIDKQQQHAAIEMTDEDATNEAAARLERYRSKRGRNG